MDLNEVIETIDNASCSISNLENVIRILTYKERIKDEKLSSAFSVVFFQIMKSSYRNGPEGETWPDWKKKPVEKQIKYICKKLGIDIRLWNIEKR